MNESFPRPRVIFVVAHDRQGVMGRDGALPWHLPEDLKHFRSLTLGKTIVMGRKTFAAIGSKPLPGRRNIVLTRDFSFAPDNVEVANSVQDIFEMTAFEPEVAIVGGAEIFNAFAPYVDTAFVTRVETEVEGDVHYHAPERPHTTELIGSHAADERHAYAMTFVRVDYANAVTGGSLNESKPSR